MANVPAKVASRISSGVKKFQPLLAAAKARDINESDTVVLVTDVLHEIFGYNKYSEITSEHMIRSTYCDLAIKLDNGLAVLIEVKAIGTDLKDTHVKQAVDYAANQGCDWVALTTGAIWRVYKVLFAKPIEHELVVEFDLIALNVRKDADMELAWLLAKESWQKAKIGEYHLQRQALSRYCMAAVILSEPVLDVIRRELRRMSPDVRIDPEVIAEVLRNEVIKRDALEGEKAESARKMVNRASNKSLRATKVAPASKPESKPPSV